jgi:hypothetical protein
VISCELVLLSIVVNYIGYDCMYVVRCILPILNAPRPGWQPKHPVVKKIKILYKALKSTNIWAHMSATVGDIFINR